MKSYLNRLSWYRAGRLPVFLQSETSECGLACLAMIARYHGIPTTVAALRQKFSVPAQGSTLRSIIEIAAAIGLRSRPIRFELRDIEQVQTPCILHWDLSHFVVLKSRNRKTLTIHDPALGKRSLRLSDVGRHITGVALELSPGDSFRSASLQDSPPPRKLRISDLWTRVSGLRRALIQAFILSVILQAFLIASPLYMQLVVDEVATKHNPDLLLVLLLGFSILYAIHIVANALRSYVLLHLGALISFQMVGNLFHHMISLPISFFEKRHVGDIISRFQSTQPIQKLLVEDLIASVLDGLMAITILVVMFIYSPLLSWIVIAVLAIHIVISFLVVPIYRERTQQAIIATADENSSFIETLSAMQPIRLFGAELEREHDWQNRYSGVVNSTIRLGHVNISIGFIRDLATSVQTLVVIYVGAKLILAAELTIGMLFAFVAWKDQFGQRIVSLVQRGIDFRLLDLHLQRIADIAQTPKEVSLAESVSSPSQLTGALEARDIAFSYSPLQKPILTSACLFVAAGECIAITGVSGSGKSTLVKILSGLIQPTGGKVIVDGQAIQSFGLRNYRAQIATAMQDDKLLTGSILDNITFFDRKPNMELAEHCAKTAAIHEEIMDWPMKYQTMVGALGSFLSGGQRQRIVLARALYRQPRILFLDEGTSHLDLETEAKINAGLAASSMTRILVAHRPETVRYASKVYRIVDGVTQEREKF